MSAKTWERIPAERFAYELYCGKQWIGINEIWADEGEWPACVLKPGVVPVGFTNSNMLRVRPRDEGFAILVELEDGTEVWSHVQALPRIP